MSWNEVDEIVGIVIYISEWYSLIVVMDWGAERRNKAKTSFDQLK